MKGLLVLDLAPEDDEPFTPGPTEVGSGGSRTSRTAPAEARAVCEAGGRKRWCTTMAGSREQGL
jgi:hypothetical protein